MTAEQVFASLTFADRSLSARTSGVASVLANSLKQCSANLKFIHSKLGAALRSSGRFGIFGVNCSEFLRRESFFAIAVKIFLINLFHKNNGKRFFVREGGGFAICSAAFSR